MVEAILKDKLHTQEQLLTDEEIVEQNLIFKIRDPLNSDDESATVMMQTAFEENYDYILQAAKPPSSEDQSGLVKALIKVNTKFNS